jgi:hypothetical protein
MEEFIDQRHSPILSIILHYHHHHITRIRLSTHHDAMSAPPHFSFSFTKMFSTA